VIAAFVDADGLFLAFARDPGDAAAGAARYASARLGAGERPTCEASGSGVSTGGLTRAWLSRTRRGCGTQEERGEIVIGDRIFVFLPHVSLLDEHINAGRKCARPRLALEQPDRPCVLLASKDKLRFFIPLHGLAPHGHGDGHHDGHDAHADQERGHRVPFLLTP
jgi:hypothetical protein